VFKRRKPDEMQPADPSVSVVGAADEPIHPDMPTRLLPAAALAPRDGDSGLGVPPFRPASPKEAFMGRSPFAPVPAPVPGPGMPPAAPVPGAAARPAAVPPPRAAGRDAAERRTLVVGRGISLQGTVQDAERLVVEGTVEATMIHATELSIAPGGVFKGEVEVEEAEIAGTIDGTLTARHSLQIRATGKVLGTARCRRLQVEDGGQITGRMEMLGEGAARPADAKNEVSA
jgi:cytoskeletal protein CcmA (bactofilin family)